MQYFCYICLNTLEMLIKGIDASFKDADVKQGIVTGYIAHFDSKDSDGDVIQKGAFTKSIQERGPQGSKLIKYLLDHDKKHAIGVFTELKEDSIGLYYEAKVGSHANGVDFLKMVESEIINQHSIGYSTIKEQTKSDANYISEIKLYEGSALQFLGANSNTPITGMKELSDALSQLSLLEKSIRTGTLTDETYLLIEAKIKSLNAVLEPKLITLKNNEPIGQILEHLKNSLN